MMTAVDSSMVRESLEPHYHAATYPLNKLEPEPDSVLSHLCTVKSSSFNLETRDTLVTTSLSPSPPPEKIEYKAKLTPYYNNISNAKDYVFLGSCDMSINSDMGITLDKNGQLIMIQGLCRNTLNNWKDKYKGITHHKYFIIENVQQETPLNFESLYLDAKGKLTGKIRDSDYLYTINIETHTSFHSQEKRSNTIHISFTKKHSLTERENGKHYSYLDASGKHVRLELKNENIYLQEYGNRDIFYDYSLMEYQLTLSINKNYKILSMKPAKNKIQLETEHNNKKRIFYLDPQDISTSSLRARGITHQPPQSMLSSLGGNIHEVSNSGQPYSSGCKANFSSRHIPLVSMAIGNLRFHFKKVKQYHCHRKRKNILAHLFNGIDPGFCAIASTTKNLSRKVIKAQENNKSGFIKENMMNLHHDFASLFKEIPDIITPGTSFSEGVLTLLNKTKPNDIISISHESHFSLFFNLLQTGIPLTQGWFFGVLLSITKSHHLELAKTDQGDIRVFFTVKKKKNIGILIGTGQGLESSKIHSGNINFLSVMPFEANLILSAYQNKQMNISLTMTKEHFISFIEQKDIPPISLESRNDFLENAIINVSNERQGALAVDMKMSELRAMVGIQPTDNLTCLLPRASGGLSCNVELLSLSSKKMLLMSKIDHQFSQPLKQTKLKLLTATMGATGGVKFIMNPNIADDNGKLNFRTSLIEDNQSYKRKTKSLIEIASNNTPEPSTLISKPANAKYINQLEKKLAKILPERRLCRSIKHLHRIKFSRPLRKTSSPLPTKVINRCFGRKPTPASEFSRVFEDNCSEGNFSTMMEKIQQDALSKERSSFHKSKMFFFDACYELDEASHSELSRLQEMFSTLIANQQRMSSDALRVELEHLHQRIILLKITAQYRLRTLKISSIGKLSKIKATLINVIINFRTIKSLAYTQTLGTLTFEYRNKHDVLPHEIHGNYHVI